MTDNIIETAMCLWEEVLNIRRDPNVTYAFDMVGTSAIRNQIGTMAEACDADYQAAVATGYDDCFDWEFVPGWIHNNVVFDEHGASRK